MFSRVLFLSLISISSFGCIELFEKPKKITKAAFKKYCKEIERLSDAYMADPSRDLRSYNSPLRGSEHENSEIKLLDLPPGDLIYFGSGVDIFRPLRSFPTVGDIHLVENGDGTNFIPDAGAIKEIRDRLSTFPSSKITESVVDHGIYNETIFEVEWQSDALGIMKKRIHIHNVDYYENFDALMESFKDLELSALLFFATFLPKKKTEINKIVSQLNPNGMLFFELFRGDDGNPSDENSMYLDELGLRKIQLKAYLMPELYAFKEVNESFVYLK